MLNLLKTDMKRVFGDVLFRVACILGAVFGVVMPLMYFGMSKMLGEMSDMGEMFGLYFDAKTIFFSSMAPGGDFGLIVPVFVIIALCKDFSQGTVRNKLICGKSRTSVFLSMFITCSVVLTGLVLAQGLVALGISLCFFDYQPGLFDMADFGYLMLSILFEIVVYVFVSALISFLCVFMKNAGLAVVLYIALNFVFALIGGIVSAAYSVMSALEGEEGTLSVLEFFANSNPFSSGLIGSGSSYTGSDVLYIVLPPVLLGAMFVLFGILVFRKKDVK